MQIEERKKIIFCDWTVRYWLAEKTTNVVFHLQLLLDDGFQIYLWQGTSLRLLDDPWLLLDKEIQEMIEFAEDQTLFLSALEQYRFLPKQLMIINYHELPLILGEQKIQRHQFRYNDLISMNLRFSYLISLYPQFSEVLKVQKMYSDSDSDRDSYSDTELEEDYYDTPPQGITMIPITDDAPGREFERLCRSMHTIVDELSFSELDWTGLIQLSLYGFEINTSAFKQTKRLRVLELSEVTSLGGSVLNLDFKQLFHLEIDAVKDPLSSLENCPHLKTVTLNNLDDNQICNLFNGAFVLPLLKEIIIDTNEYISINSMKKIKNVAKNVKKIKIYGKVSTEHINDDEEAMSFLFDESVSVHIDMSIDNNIPNSMYFLSQFIRLFKCVESIGFNIGDFESLDLTAEKHIKEAIRYAKSITTDSISNGMIRLLSDLTEIKSIALTRNSSQTCDTLFKQIPLSSVETISVSNGVQLTGDAFVSLLEHENKIKKLLLHVPMLTSIPNANLCHLESLNVREISHHALYNLTKSSRVLKYLKCSKIDIEHIPIIKWIIKNNTQLETLDIAISDDLMDAELEALIKNIPNFDPDGASGMDDDLFVEDRCHKEKTVDLDTELRSTTFQIPSIFKIKQGNFVVPHPARYRLHTYNVLKFKDGLFLLDNTVLDDLTPWTPIDAKEQLSRDVSLDLQTVMDEDVCMGNELEREPDTNKTIVFIGQQSFKQLRQDWEPIASLSPRETLLAIKTTPHKLVDIAYSKRDNIYYIRSREGSVSFLLEFEIHCVPIKIPQIQNQGIQSWIRRFNQFKPGVFNASVCKTLGDAIRELVTQQVGACRHRAVAFFYFIKIKHPHVPVRIVSNDCHMYVEICQEGVWIQCDLGGYPAIVETHEQPHRLLELDTGPMESKPSEPMDCSPAPTMLESLISDQFDKQLIDIQPLVQQASLEAYIQTLFTSIHRTQRIDLPAAFNLNFNRSLQQQARQNGHPLFYVHGPDDLICSSSFIRLKSEGIGEHCEGPGGALYDFLSTECFSSKAPILIVNYTTFSEQDLAKWNHLLDRPRQTDAISLPDSVILLGLFDPMVPLNYDAADFDCRFDTIQAVPDELLNKHEWSLPIQTPMHGLCADKRVINLCRSPHWRSILLDHWIIKEGALVLEPGALRTELLTQKPIEIQNPPEGGAFLNAWALLSVNLPVYPPIYFTKGYQWNWNKRRVEQTRAPATGAYILNPSQLPFFIKVHSIISGKISQEAGVIAQHADSILHLYITRDLSEDEWGVFYQEYQRYPNIQLSFACAKDVAPPPGIDRRCMGTDSPMDQDRPSHTRWIVTNDIDLALLHVREAHDWQLIDISESYGSDLLTRLECVDRASYQFQVKRNVLLNAMDQEQNIILIGDFSDTLIDDLAPFLMQRIWDKAAKGNLMLISDKIISYLTPSEHFDFSWQDKKKNLSDLFSFESIESKPESFRSWSYIKQITALAHEQAYPGAPYTAAWDGLQTLHSGIQLTRFDSKTYESEAEQFVICRERRFVEALRQWHFMVITGLTGVGKTTFVEQYFQGHSFYQGTDTDTLIEWATEPAHSNKEIVLFIDESNLLHRDWSEFEGLQYGSKQVLIDGAFYPLSINHKIIFACNPLSYSDDRKLARLFDRHGHALVFDPLSTAYIYKYIIKPIFDKTGLSFDEQEAIGSVILDVYQFIIESSEDSVMISPREVQMMALLVVQEINLKPLAHRSMTLIEQAAKTCAYAIGRGLILPSKKTCFDRFFQPEKSLTLDSWNSGDYVYTEPRSCVIKTLCQYLHLRASRREHIGDLNEAQSYGGLGAVIVEGEAGIGKKALVNDVLSHFRLKKDLDYVVLNPSIPFCQKKVILINAFDAGHVVIINEFNTSPMMEGLLNCLLMGKSPEGLRPKNPGFLIIGIQKPAITAGRSLPSNALSRRIQNARLEAYTSAELDIILNEKGVKNEDERTALITVFNRKKKEESTFRGANKLTFFNLMVVAESHRLKKREREWEEPVVAQRSIEIALSHL